MGRVLLERLESWVVENQILTDVQYDFRRGVGTTEQCTNLHLLISKYTLAKEGHAHLCFADLNCTFDLVNHAKLWQSLAKMGASTEIVTFLSQLYAQLTARVRYGSRGEVTPHFKITRGTCQGCVLAPLLFLLYING